MVHILHWQEGNFFFLLNIIIREQPAAFHGKYTKNHHLTRHFVMFAFLKMHIHNLSWLLEERI